MQATIYIFKNHAKQKKPKPKDNKYTLCFHLVPSSKGQTVVMDR